MAYIDMKQCQFFIEDGYSKVGAVNLMAGYAIGLSTIAVDGFTGAVETGIQLTFAGHDTVYHIVSHSETSLNTTSIVITPVLTDAVINDEVITTGPHILEIKIGEGNCTFDEKRALEYKKNRGKLDKVRLADEDPIDVNLQFAWEFLSSSSGATVPTVEEVLRQEGPAEDYVSTSTDSCEPYAVNLVILNSQTNCGSESYPIEKITLPMFRHTSLNHDPKAGTVTVQGTCNVTKAIRERLAE